MTQTSGEPLTTDATTDATEATTGLTTEPPPECGNGVLEAGEACDDGPDNGPGQLCKENCTANICGDGDLGPHEACDDGNLEDGDGCSSACTLEPLRVFITATRYEGNLGGIAGADMLCTQAAASANLGGTWKAWLSSQDPDTSPAMRFTHAEVAYVRLDGEVIADNWQALLAGPLAVPININELGVEIEDTTRAWTNVNPDGTPAMAGDCLGWEVPLGEAGFGISTATSMLWTAAGPRQCNTFARLYCFEQ